MAAQAPARPSLAGAFDHLFVTPPVPAPDARPLPLPDGWRHSALVARLRHQPLDRRRTVMAGIFGLVAALWAPLGFIAFFGHWLTAFLLVTAVVLAVAVLPRPHGLGERLGRGAAFLRARLRGLVGDGLGQSMPRSAR